MIRHAFALVSPITQIRLGNVAEKLTRRSLGRVRPTVSESSQLNFSSKFPRQFQKVLGTASLRDSLVKLSIYQSTNITKYILIFFFDSSLCARALELSIVSKIAKISICISRTRTFRIYFAVTIIYAVNVV